MEITYANQKGIYLGDLNRKELKACDVYGQSIDRFPTGPTYAYQQSISVRLVDDTGYSSNVFNSTLEKYEGQGLVSILSTFTIKNREYSYYLIVQVTFVVCWLKS